MAEGGELWSASRGPDPITEYELFRKNILSNLKAKVCNLILQYIKVIL